MFTQSRKMLFEELGSDGELNACLETFIERKSMCCMKNAGSMLYLLPMTDNHAGDIKPRIKTICPAPPSGVEVEAKKAPCCSCLYCSTSHFLCALLYTTIRSWGISDLEVKRTASSFDSFDSFCAVELKRLWSWSIQFPMS